MKSLSRTFRMASLVALFCATAGWLPACSDRGGVEEAVEELKDETKDTKEAIEDEIDDHT